MKYAILFLTLILSACITNPSLPDPEQILVKQTEYVVRIPPRELMALPVSIGKIDVDKAKQSDIAQWVLKSEDRTRTLENMIIEIGKFLRIEERKLEEEASVKNRAALEAAANEQADFAKKAAAKQVVK